MYRKLNKKFDNYEDLRNPIVTAFCKIEKHLGIIGKLGLLCFLRKCKLGYNVIEAGVARRT